MKRHDDTLVAEVKADLAALEADKVDAPDPFVEELSEEDKDAVAEIAALLEPEDPPTSLRERLLASAESGRFARFGPAVAKLLDLDDARAEELLDGIDDPDNWSPNPLPGVTIYHIAGGEKVADCITGFTKIDRDGGFPPHEHLGHEYVLVLQGRVRDGATGEVFGPGQLSIREPGTGHNLEVLPGPALIYLVVMFEGLSVMGIELRPGDPRI